jgi:branched-chain amino acid transport system substrate-binding protein
MKYRRAITGCVAAGLVAGVAACSSGSSSTTSVSTSTSASTSASAAGAPSSTATGSTATGTPIVIGSVGTYTQGTGGFTDPGKPAIEAWASWVNAHGGINGHPVKLIVEDNKGDQAQAVSMVKQLVQQDHVVAFVSNQDGSLNAGYASYLDQQKIPVLGGSVFTLDPWVSDPMFYPEGLTAIQDMTSLAISAKQLGITTVGSLACSEAAQCAAANGLAKAVFGGAGIPDNYGGLVSSTATDYTASCIAAEQKGVKGLILLVPTASEGQVIAGDCQRQNYSPSYIIPGEAIGAGYLQSAAFNNAFTSAPTLPWFSTAPAMADFNAAMKQYAPSLDLNSPSVQEPLTATDAWVSGLMFQEAVKLSGATGIPTSADILAGLAKFKNETLGGMAAGLTYTNPKNKTEGCYFTIQIKSQKFTLPNGATPSCVPAA